METSIDLLRDIFLPIGISIITALIIIPLVFIINKKMEFDDELFALMREIKKNENLINNINQNVNEVSSGNRSWLCGIASNRPLPEYVNRYLSLNVYNNFINSKYWIHVGEGSAGQIAELYYYFGEYCEIILKFEKTIPRNQNKVPLNYSDYDALLSNRVFNSLATQILNKINNEFNFEDINRLKNKYWWYPKWLKELLLD